MTYVHICRPRGYYVGQVRRRGCRKWRQVTFRPVKSAEKALAAAVLKMGQDDHRARAVFVDSSGYYGATVVMEAKR